MESQEPLRAWREWLTEYHFKEFVTLTFPTVKSLSGRIPRRAKIKINHFMRDMSKRFKKTFGALGFICLGHSGHLHAHLLMLEKNCSDISDLERELFRKAWPHQSAVKPIYYLRGAARYSASPKHLIYGKKAEFYSYGKMALNRNRNTLLAE